MTTASNDSFELTRHLMFRESLDLNRDHIACSVTGFPVIEGDSLFAPRAGERIGSNQQDLLAVPYLHLPLLFAGDNCQGSCGQQGTVGTYDDSFEKTWWCLAWNLVHAWFARQALL